MVVKVGCGAVDSLVVRFAWGDLGVGENFVCRLFMVVIFIGHGRAHRLGVEIRLLYGG